MKILLDANLSWRLVGLLADHFEDVKHVDRCGLPVPASDQQVWEWAKSNGFAILTCDEDFYHLVLQKGFPPKVVLLKLGNRRTRSIAQVLVSHAEELREFERDPNLGLLEIVS
ncbi:MAG: hypothetical protein D6765_05155 [Bacteroidetes bacterium]|nr:MAG: hypothetical protein D6765_05155 [Bacteroidota bacterium]